MTTEIIIPFHGRINMLRRCIDVLDTAAENSYSISLVDDCSSHRDIEMLLNAIPPGAPVTLTRMKKRCGFVGAVNHAWSKCTGEIAVILNSDTVPGPHLIPDLIAVLKNDKHIAAVGPASDNDKDLFQFRELLPHRSRKPQTLHYSFTDYLTGMCLAIRRAAIPGQLLFDPAYAPGYFEDLDLCCRLRQNGWKLAILESECIHHEGAATFGDEPALDSIIHINYSRFSKKWGHLPEHNKLDLLLCQ
jgi:GT2 family glycosyltransferase